MSRFTVSWLATLFIVSSANHIHRQSQSQVNHLSSRQAPISLTGPSQPINSPTDALGFPEAPLEAKECTTDKCYCSINLETNEPIVNCKGKKLQDIPTFSPIDTVYYEIDFSDDNFIRALPNNSFANLKVKRINLLNNHLSADIQPNAFNGVELYLEELKLEGNEKIPIPYNRMTRLTKLRRLKVKSFRQDLSSENDYFQYFPNLETLEMVKINALAVDATTFKGKVPRLMNLELEEVYISEIPVIGLRELTRLQSLKINNNNRLETIRSGSFKDLRDLRMLYLKHNSIKQINNDAFDGITQSLTELNLGSNYIQLDSLTSLSSKTWTNLEYLTLSYNTDLSILTESVFKSMPKLNYLYMVGINLKTVSRDLLSGLNNLHALDLSYNEIETIEDRAFSDNQKLVEIKLDFQYRSSSKDMTLPISPTAFTGLDTSLLRLNLQSTPIVYEQFWKTLKTLKGLQELILRGTNMDAIPNFAFQQNKKIWKLNLQENNIKELKQSSFKGLEGSLEDVTFESNNIKTISECLFKNFTRLTSIRLQKNPLACDCKLVWFHRFLHQDGGSDAIFMKDDVICNSPANFDKKLLYDIPETTLCSTVVPEVCHDSELPPTPSTTRKPDPVTGSPSNNLQMSIPSTTEDTILVTWNVNDKSQITRYKLEYFLTTDKYSKREIYPHRDQTWEKLHNLLPGKYYMVCMTAEVNQVWDTNSKACQTTQTRSQSNGSQGQGSGGKTNDNSGESRNVIIGALIATVAVVVLIAVGVCAIVKYKYKMQRLQELQFGLASPAMARRHPHLECADDDMMVCTIPNEYMEISNAKMAQKYLHSPRLMRRQLGVDGDESPYNTYQRIRIRRNPYENDSEEEIENEGVGLGNSEEILFKPDLSERHSAPSRLDAKELMKTDNDKNPRPLPATPEDQQEKVDKNKGRSNTLKTKHGKNKDPQKRDLETNKKRDAISNTAKNEVEISEIPEYTKVKKNNN